MKQHRPVNLNLMTVRFPVTAISSICHRVSGVVIFLGVPLVLWALSKALASPAAFDEVKNCLSSPLGLFVSWVFLVAMTYHLLAGVRHMIMDMGYGEHLQSGRIGATLVLVLGAVFAILEVWWLLW